MDTRPFKAWPVRKSMLTSFVATPEAGIAETSEIALQTITVASSKSEDKAVDVLAGSTVVNRTEVDRNQSSRLSDVLNASPDLDDQEDSDGPASVIDLRRLQDFSRVNVMIEGARQNNQRSGHGGEGQVYLEPEMIKQVDITRWPVSPIYCSSAICGVLNFGARLTSVAAQNRVPAGTPASLSYDLLDLFATYKHNRYFSTSLTSKNVTDKQYVPFRQAEGRPSAGFAALISATIKVGG